MDVKSLYSFRFSGQIEIRRRMWQVLCASFFQKYFPVESTVVEIGAGYCEFINAIRASIKIAVDINPDTTKYAAKEVQVIQSTSTSIPQIERESIDRVFASNFFEHLEHGEILQTLNEIQRILKPGGAIVILQPNFRYCYKDYFMFFDHISALDHRSMEEALTTAGFHVSQNTARFLPYTTRGRLPNSIFLLKLYLKLPILWNFFGGQMMIVAEKTLRP
jgi:ubiquinone/menaquinone biosynthesis C-methylase UbiE